MMLSDPQDTARGSSPSPLEDALGQVRALSAKVELLQREVAASRTRHLGADESDRGIGSLRTEREASFDEVERLAQVGSWLWDVRSGEVVWSEEFYRIFGYEPGRDQASVDNFYAALHPEDRTFLQSRSAWVASTGLTAPGARCRVVHRDGAVRHVILNGAPIRDRSGELIRIVGAALDVTEFVTVETELRHTAQLLNEAERIAALGSWSWEACTDSFEWSETMYGIFSVAPATPITQELFLERVHPDDRQRVFEAQVCVEGDQGSPVAYRVLWPDGTLRHVTMQARSERDARGVPVRTVGTVQDITQRKQLEEQLRHSQKMEAIGTLAGGIAHDFNNYLLVIQGNVDLMKLSLPSDSAAHERLSEIATANERCAALTRHLLALARQRVSAPKLVDVGQVVTHTARLLRRLVGEHIELQLCTPSEAMLVRIDPAHLEQVLVNLVVNARDAMFEGGVVTIDVRACTAGSTAADSLAAVPSTLPAGRYVRLSVTDTGSGIAPAVQSRIFEPFFTTKAQGKGTGLGLSTVYGIVRQWQGELQVISQEGEGTQFHIWLPAQAGEIESAVPRRETSTPRRQGEETVLLVEDEPQVRQLVQTLLEQAGFVVLVARDGREALEVATHTAKLDLLLSDVRMPRLGGVELANKLRSTWPQIKVLLMSGYADSSASARDASDLRAPILAKPFDTGELLDRVRQVLEASQL